jgi:hypothetical protein
MYIFRDKSPRLTNPPLPILHYRTATPALPALPVLGAKASNKSYSSLHLPFLIPGTTPTWRQLSSWLAKNLQLPETQMGGGEEDDGETSLVGT